MQNIVEASEKTDEIAALFRETFTASEGADEGALISDLARSMMTTTAPEDLLVCVSEDAGAMTGCILFSRMWFGDAPQSAFVLSPVAVAPTSQRQGIGQKMIRFGLARLHKSGVDIALTYGDPAYYARVGFRQADVDMVPPPLALSYPEGWLVQMLSNQPLAPLPDPSRCVAALNNPNYW